MLGFFLVLLLSEVAMGGWDKGALVARENERVEIVCTFSSADPFALISVSYRAKENGANKARTVSENEELTEDYKASGKYSSHLEGDTVTIVFESIRFLDSGILACSVMDGVQQPSFVNITVITPINEAKLELVAAEGLKGIMNKDGKLGELHENFKDFSESFFQNFVSSRDSASPLEIPFNSPNHLVCYANCKSPYFKVKFKINNEDLDTKKHPVTYIRKPEIDVDDEVFSLKDPEKEDMSFKAVVLDKADHTLHNSTVACVAEISDLEPVEDHRTVFVEFAPQITCNIKAFDKGGSEVVCKVKANPLANVKVIKGNKVIGSKVPDINFDGYQYDDPRAGLYETQNDDDDAYDNNGEYRPYNAQGGRYENQEDDDDDDEVEEGEEEEEEEEEEEDEREEEKTPQIKVEKEEKEDFDFDITNQDSSTVVVTIRLTKEQTNNYNNEPPISIQADNAHGSTTHKLAITIVADKPTLKEPSAINSPFSGCIKTQISCILTIFTILSLLQSLF